MATNYPNSKQTFTDYTAGAVITSVDLNAVRDTVEAIEDKVGVNGSSDVNSLTYKVENASSVNPGHKHGISGLSATGTASSTTFLRGDNTWATPVSATDASTTVKGISKLSVAPAVANDPIAVGTNDPRLGDANYVSKGLLRVQDSATISGLNISGGVLSVNSGTGANQIVRLNASGQLPAVDGSLLTNVTVTNRGTLTISSSGTSTITVGFRPSHIYIQSVAASGGAAVASQGGYTSGGLSYCSAQTYNSNGNSQGVFLGTDRVLHIQTGFNPTATTATISNITSTGFDIVRTMGTTGCDLIWVAVK